MPDDHRNPNAGEPKLPTQQAPAGESSINGVGLTKGSP
jgi:hypothetical protein